MFSDIRFNPDIDVRKSGEGGRRGSRSWRGGGVGESFTIADSKAISLNEL
ncbi:hypothetical protein [Mycoplasmoides genitalium]